MKVFALLAICGVTLAGCGGAKSGMKMDEYSKILTACGNELGLAYPRRESAQWNAGSGWLVEYIANGQVSAKQASMANKCAADRVAAQQETSPADAPKAKPQSGGSPMIATNPRPVLDGSGKVVPAKSAAAPATAPAKAKNTTETQSGYTSPQTAPVSTGVNPECPAGASLFIGGAGLCPQ